MERIGNVNFRVIDTTPGRDWRNPFSPPEGFTGDGRGYRDLLRERYKTNPWLRQCIGVLLMMRSRQVPFEIVGPWCNEMREILDLFWQRAYGDG